MFKYTLDNKRYHTLNYHFKTKYNSKVVKISLNAGFSCPNIDGTVGYGASDQFEHYMYNGYDAEDSGDTGFGIFRIYDGVSHCPVCIYQACPVEKIGKTAWHTGSRKYSYKKRWTDHYEKEQKKPAL